jgi:hypothetical protein
LSRRAITTLLAALGVVLPSVSVRADGDVTIRGAYYRESSTRVIQPVVAINQNLPGGFDVHTTYLLDAITSASANAGAAKDEVFTELRNEVSLGVGKTWNKTRATLGYIYSAESDYWSHTLHASGSQGLWGDTATMAVALGLSFESATARGRTPFCAVGDSVDCSLNVYFGGLSYTQIITPTFITELDLESAYLDGFQGNLYRTVPMSPLTYENPPEKRVRNAVAARLAYFFPSTETGLQLHYRYYFDVYPGTAPTAGVPDPQNPAGFLKPPGYDPWRLQSHTIELRVYQQLSPTLQVRLTYRQYIQNEAASFWCDTLANPGCYSAAAVPFSILGTPESSDPKLGKVYTEYPEVKLIWDAEPWRDVPFFRWFASGTFEISYGYYYQNTSFGNAHVLQTGYTMPY